MIAVAAPYARRVSLGILVWALLAGTAAAQTPDITVNILTPRPTGSNLFGQTLLVEATVASVRQLASVVASIGGRSIPLTFGTTWRGTLTTGDLPRGPFTLVVTATDVTSAVGTAQRALIHDNPPAIEYLSPEWNALARPDVRVHARCTDDGGPCQLSARGVTAEGELDAVVSLIDLDGAAFNLEIRATDSAGQTSVSWRPVFVESSPRLSLVATLPGLILDIDTTRAVIVHELAPRTLQLVNRTTGAAQVLFTEGARTIEEGRLTPTGVLFMTRDPSSAASPYRLHEWRGGAVTDLGTIENRTLRVAGSWAVWRVPGVSNPCCTPDGLVRRDLTAGTNASVPSLGAGFGGPRGADVATTGDVSFSDSVSSVHSEVFRYSGGSTTPVTNNAGLSPGYTTTDGVNIGFTTEVDGTNNHGIRLWAPGGEEQLTSNWTMPTGPPASPEGGRDLQTVNGWTAFTRNASGGSLQVWTRSPAGTLRQVSSIGTFATIDALAPDGNLAFSVWVLGRGRFVSMPSGGTPIRIGSTLGTARWLDNAWHVTVGPHLLRFTLVDRHVLPEGATGTFFDLDVAVLNPGSAPVQSQVTFLREDGTRVDTTQTFAPHARATLRVDEQSGVTATATSTVVDSLDGSPLVVERTMTWDASGYGGHSSSALDGPRLRWYFAEGAQGYFDTFVLLANDGTQNATARLSFLVEGGSPVLRTVAVPAQRRVTVHAGSIPELVNRSFSIVVESDRALAAERAMYFGTTTLWEGGHASAGVPDASTLWYHAEGATSPTFDTYILLSNPNAQPTPAFVRFITDTGTSVGVPLTLPARSRVTLPAKAVAGLANASFGTAINADLPIVAERAMYWSAVPGGPWIEAHNSFGVPTLGTKWGLADGRVGGTRGYQTYVLVANPSATTAAQLRVTFMREDGVQVQRLLTLAPTRRLNVFANDIPELANASFGVVVESTNGVPIAVERATYWNARGVTWAGGTNVTGTRLP